MSQQFRTIRIRTGTWQDRNRGQAVACTINHMMGHIDQPIRGPRFACWQVVSHADPYGHPVPSHRDCCLWPCDRNCIAVDRASGVAGLDPGCVHGAGVAGCAVRDRFWSARPPSSPSSRSSMFDRLFMLPHRPRCPSNKSRYRHFSTILRTAARSGSETAT
jgi:hypothetical protein